MEIIELSDRVEMRRWIETKHYARRLPPVEEENDFTTQTI